MRQYFTIIFAQDSKNPLPLTFNRQPFSMSEKETRPQQQPNNPMHGVKLATVLEVLVDYYGWEHLSYKVNINCFKHDPSIKSSLTFLRKTPWAREKVEGIYLELVKKGLLKNK